MAQIQWGVQNVSGVRAAVYRRQMGTPWSSIATIANDGSGTLTYQDHAVTPGARYGYQLVVPSQQGAVPGGEVWVDVPTSTTGVPGSPPPGPGLALQPVRPNPLVDRFVVSFGLPNADRARLDLIDLSGRQVLTREVGSLGPGTHQLDLGSARDLAPGMYFVRLSQSGRALTARAVVTGQRGAIGR